MRDHDDDLALKHGLDFPQAVPAQFGPPIPTFSLRYRITCLVVQIAFILLGKPAGQPAIFNSLKYPLMLLPEAAVQLYRKVMVVREGLGRQNRPPQVATINSGDFPSL